MRRTFDQPPRARVLEVSGALVDLQREQATRRSSPLAILPGERMGGLVAVEERRADPSHVVSAPSARA
jgi:hypothetical protein